MEPALLWPQLWITAIPKLILRVWHEEMSSLLPLHFSASFLALHQRVVTSRWDPIHGVQPAEVLILQHVVAPHCYSIKKIQPTQQDVQQQVVASCHNPNQGLGLC